VACSEVVLEVGMGVVRLLVSDLTELEMTLEELAEEDAVD